MTPSTPDKTTPRRSRGRPPFLPLTILLLSAGFIFSIAIYQRVRGLKPGQLSPPDARNAYALDLATLDGQRWKLSDHAGHVVIVNYFATWCGPCHDEFPDLCKIADDYTSRGVDVAAVGLNSDTDSLKNFAASQHATFPILLPAAATPANEMIPYTFLLDRHGRIAYFMLGRFDATHLRSLVDRLLLEP